MFGTANPLGAKMPEVPKRSIFPMKGMEATLNHLFNIHNNKIIITIIIIIVIVNNNNSNK